MNTATAATILHRLRTLASCDRPAESNAELLRRFCNGDQVAFEAIVRRYGRLVFGVCHHVLGHVEDAEDAFQATFLVLARRAASVRKPEALSAWLHGVARHTAMRTLRDSNRRKARERQVRGLPAGHEPGETSLLELQALLDAEVQRLPEPYRAVIVLSVLESGTTAEIAAQLGWKPGTVSGRLTRARQMLTRRLARLGVTLSAALTALAMDQQSARAMVPPRLTESASQFTAAGGVPQVEASARVLELARGVGRSTMLARSSVLLAVALTAAAASIGAACLRPSEARPAGAQSAQNPVEVASNAPPAGSVPADTDWLKEIDRTIRKEPAYETKSPHYALLAFGPRATDRVWLVHDGATLYVDRKADGDLTDPADKLAGEISPGGTAKDAFIRYVVGDLSVGGRVHKNLKVYADLLTESHNSVESRENAKAALAANPKARAYTVYLEVDWPGLKGKGEGGRTKQAAGPVDGRGALLFGVRPAEAPVICFGGPLQITFEAQPPVMKLGWDNTAIMVVGSAGHGPGTTAALAYDGTIPDSVVPIVEATFPSRAGTDRPPLRQRYELKDRCCGINLYGPLRPPPEAGPGVAKFTVSLSSWDGMNVRRSEHQTMVVERKPDREPVSERLLRSLPHPNQKARISFARFSAAGARLLTAGAPTALGPGVLQCWDVDAGKELWFIKWVGFRHSVRFSQLPADWSALYVPYEQRKLVDSVQNGKQTRREEFEGAVRVFDPATGQPRPSLEPGAGHGVVQLAVSPDGRRLFAIERQSIDDDTPYKDSAVLWDIGKGTAKPLDGAPADGAFSPDSRRLLLSIHEPATQTAAVRLLDSEGGFLAELAAAKDSYMHRPTFSRDGRFLAIEQYRLKESEGRQPRVRVWNAETRKEVAAFGSKGGSMLADYTLSPDGSRLAATDETGCLQVWEIATARVLREATLPEKLEGRRVQFSPDGRRLALSVASRVQVNNYADKSPDPRDFLQPRIYLFDMTNPAAEPEILIAPPGLAGGALAWSPDGRTLAVGSAGATHLFSMAAK
jgi:RNA polymerase sigma factor (sigma-70 family)